MNTPGEETRFKAIGAGLSYDSMFVFGEVAGHWRGWRPARTNWSSCPANCTPDYRGDGYCDEVCNVAECDFDMGDCCQETCEEKVGGVTLHRKYSCGSGSYACKSQEIQGWESFYNNTWYIGQRISTQYPSEMWYRRNDVTRTYKS